MPLNRRELLQATGSAVIGAAFAADRLGAAQAATGEDVLDRERLRRLHAGHRWKCRGCGRTRAVHRARSDPAKPLPAWRLHGDSRDGGRRRGGGCLARAHRPGAGTCARPSTALRPGRVSSPTITSPRARCRQTGCPQNGPGSRRSRPAPPGALHVRQSARLPGVRDQGRPAGHADRHLRIISSASLR